MTLIYKESRPNKNISLILSTSCHFICYNTWKVGYQTKPFQKELLDRNPSAGSPSSVKSDLRCCNAPRSITVSIAVLPRMVPPGAALASSILFLHLLATLSPTCNITYTVFLLNSTESLGSRENFPTPYG